MGNNLCVRPGRKSKRLNNKEEAAKFESNNKEEEEKFESNNKEEEAKFESNNKEEEEKFESNNEEEEEEEEWEEEEWESSSEDEDSEDRLSTLPDDILTDIISRLSIEEAIQTSVLSQRWRPLWRGITSLNMITNDKVYSKGDYPHDKVLYTPSSCRLPTFDRFLHHLTSPKLHFVDFCLFFLHHDDVVALHPHQLDSWFRHFVSLNVEHLMLEHYFGYDIRVSASMVNSQSLVTLKLYGVLSFEFSPFDIRLPNLKYLRLDYFDHVPALLGTLISSCPLLEHLHLHMRFDLCETNMSNKLNSVNIFAPSLKSLGIDFLAVGRIGAFTFFINAPKLVDLNIRDWTSLYCFVQNPPALVQVFIDLGQPNPRNGSEQHMGFVATRAMYTSNMSNCFFRRMANVRNLKLTVDAVTNIFSHLKSQTTPFFQNLAHLTVTFNGSCHNGYKNLVLLVLSLQCFPNLQHLEVYGCNGKGEHNNWRAPVYAPQCLVSKLKTIHIMFFDNNYDDDDLKLVAYILSNAALLEELLLDLDNWSRPYEEIQIKRRQFIRSLCKLPRSSSTCKVLVPKGCVKCDIPSSYHMYYKDYVDVTYATSPGTANIVPQHQKALDNARDSSIED